MSNVMSLRQTALPSRLLRWFGALVASVRWATEMRRRCEQEMATGRLTEQDLLRIAAEVDAWIDGR